MVPSADILIKQSEWCQFQQDITSAHRVKVLMKGNEIYFMSFISHFVSQGLNKFHKSPKARNTIWRSVKYHLEGSSYQNLQQSC